MTFWQKGEDPPAETLGRPTGLGTENKLYLATPKLKQSLNREGQMRLDKAEKQSQEQKKKKKKKKYQGETLEDTGPGPGNKTGEQHRSTKTTYTTTNKRMRCRWSEAAKRTGEGKGTEKPWKDGNTHCT